MKLLFALVSGIVFGLGLIMSGMTNPAKVQGFLDLFGAWDPSLALVMAGAIAVSAPAFWIAKRRNESISGEAMMIPSNNTIDAKLIAGGVLFGAGWGIAGFCPGPALVSLSSGMSDAAIFVVAMLAGMIAFDFIKSRAQSSDA
jgi:uncharacterized protein